ncbi:MAG: DUF21 domain-containing protein [Candidatus Omnitrophica bacterium]|nr:DUF21 domain-containing protein [Candidatus Omnitrophota bacterium]
MIILYLLGSFCFIILQGFFAASEISFISSSLLKLRHRKDKGDKFSADAYRIMLSPEKFLATTLVGTNLSVILSTSLLTSFLVKAGVQNSNVWITIFFTPLIVIFAELIPKNIGRYFKEDFSIWAVKPFSIFEKLFSPVVVSIEAISKFVIRVFIGKVRPRSLFVTKEEIRLLINEIKKEGGIDKGEQEAIEEVFEFRSNKIKEVCVGIKKVAAVDYTDSYKKIIEVVSKSGYTRYPVFKNREIAGYINIYDLFYNEQENWHSFIRPITKVSVNQKLYEVFSSLRKKKESMALVFKGKRVFGIITLQDLIREIITSIVKI